MPGGNSHQRAMEKAAKTRIADELTETVLTRTRETDTVVAKAKSENRLLTAKARKPPLSDSAKLVRGVLASGAAAIFIASVYEYLSLAGVVDSMNAARIVLIFAGLVGFFGVLVSEIVWGKSRKALVLTAIGTAIVLTVGLWRLDSWTIHYRNAHAVLAPPPTASAPVPVLVPVPFEINGVRITGFGTAVRNNSGGQLNFKDSKIKNNGTGIDNRNPGAQINFDNTEISGNKKGIINRGLGERKEDKKAKQP